MYVCVADAPCLLHSLAPIHLPQSPCNSSEPSVSHTYIACEQVAYTLPGPSRTTAASNNKNGLKDEIRLVLLDERYFRETLPCSRRSNW